MSLDPKLVIFDCDGTIVDSQHVIIDAMAMAFKSESLTRPSDDDIRRIIGLSLHEAVRALAPSSEGGVIDRLVSAYKNAFIEQRKSPDFFEPLFAGARECLKELNKRDDVILGVATGKSRRGVDVLFEREGLSKFFFSIQTADDAPSKPHTGMIDNSLEFTGVARNKTLMIGDTKFDVEMARNAGVMAVGVSWGYHDEEDLRRAGTHKLVQEFGELPDLVNLLDNESSW